MDPQMANVGPSCLIGFVVLSLLGQLYKLYSQIHKCRQPKKLSSNKSILSTKSKTANSIWGYIFKTPDILRDWYKNVRSLIITRTKTMKVDSLLRLVESHYA